jgi:predicted TIM-barrel fold metal-dependent hydrolase
VKKVVTGIAISLAGLALLSLSSLTFAGGDHHMHIRSKNASAVWAAMCEMMPEACPDLAGAPPPSTGAHAIQALDEAGLDKGVIMSLGYFFGFPELGDSPFTDFSYVRAENEYVAEQVAYFPNSLVGFFSVNPFAEYANHEVSYWAEHGGLSGLKLHLANSDLDLKNPEHVAQLRAVFDVMNDYSLPVGIHLRNRNPEYGYEDAAIFIEQIAKHTPNVTLHLAHMAGWGGYDAGTDGAVQAFLDAIERGDLDRSKVWFDIAAVVMAQIPDELLEPVPGRFREIGLDRILFATDWDAAETPKEHIQSLKKRLELTDSEWDQLLSNEAPYFP